MIAKCKKVKLDYLSLQIINSNMEEFLQVGEVFHVYGLKVYKQISYIHIYTRHHLFEVPLELFEIVSNQIPHIWKIKIKSTIEVTLWPDIFYSEWFFDNLSEDELREVGWFSELRKEIEGQTGQGLKNEEDESEKSKQIK